MKTVSRTFKQPETEEECNSMSCRECAAMCSFILFPAEGWDCFNMKKNLHFRRSVGGIN